MCPVAYRSRRWITFSGTVKHPFGRGAHEGLDGPCELILKSINLLNCGRSVCYLAFESLNDFLCVAHAIPFPRVFCLIYRPVRTRFSPKEWQ